MVAVSLRYRPHSGETPFQGESPMKQNGLLEINYYSIPYTVIIAFYSSGANGQSLITLEKKGAYLLGFLAF